MKKRILCWVLVTSLIAVLAVGCSNKASEVVDAGSETIQEKAGKINSVHIEVTNENEEVINSAGVFMYVPEAMAGETQQLKATLKPIIVVLGNTAYTEESAMEAAIKGGFTDIADKEECLIAFLNPSGDTWTENDVTVYKTLLGKYADSTSDTYVDGCTKEGSYCGAKQRLYVFAEGAGADFASQYIIDDELKSDLGWMVSYFLPTGVYLSNVSEVPQNASNREYPAVIINGSEDVNTKYQGLNSNKDNYMVAETTIKDGFDAELVSKGYESVISKNRRQQIGNENLVLYTMPDYEAEGIEVSEASFTSGEISINYLTYIPENVDIKSEASVPLVVVFHGGGNCAAYHAMASEWPLIGKEKGFMVVSVDQHVSLLSETIVKMLDELYIEYPAIDQTRVYASGFSMGSVKSWNCGGLWTDYFAGIMPMDAGYMAEGESEIDTSDLPDFVDGIIPTIYVAGEEDPLTACPHRQFGSVLEEDNNVDVILRAILAKNQVVDDYQYDGNANSWWGLKPDDSYTVEATDGSKSIATVNLYKSTDGNVYTALVNTSAQSHEVQPLNSYIAWDFISQFSRNADGTINY